VVGMGSGTISVSKDWCAQMAAVLLALLAGVLTIAAPCTLPVLPALLGASVGRSGRARPAFVTLGFVISFAGVAIVFSTITQVLGIDQNTLRKAAAALLVMFGCLLFWPRAFEWLSARVGASLGRSNWIIARADGGNTGGFVLGLTLGLVWTPCAGPVLGSILTLIASSSDIAWGALLLIVYTVGASIPMLAIAYGGQAVTTRLKRIARFSHHLQQSFGLLIIAFAVAIYFDYDTLITAWVSKFYPSTQIAL
jgi:cytochrome c-type biogenesis protein